MSELLGRLRGGGGGWLMHHSRMSAMAARPRGVFAITKRSRPVKRVHLIKEAVTIWGRGELERLVVATRCDREIRDAQPFIEAPEAFELCDDCALADHIKNCVYRCFDALGRLLYIGCTANLISRFQSHSKSSAATSAWWPLLASWTFETYETRAHALAAERLAILSEQPLFNHDLTDRAKLPGRRRSTLVGAL